MGWSTCPEVVDMTMVKINARDIIVQVAADATGTTWTEIAGLTGVTPNPSENEETVDTTDYDSAGEYEEEVMQRGASMEMEGRMIKDDTTGAQDPGQARCEELATLKGYASVGRVRFRHPMDTNWKVWRATFSVGEQGGGTNDKVSWSCTVRRSGASTTEAVVVTP